MGCSNKSVVIIGDVKGISPQIPLHGVEPLSVIPLSVRGSALSAVLFAEIKYKF